MSTTTNMTPCGTRSVWFLEQWHLHIDTLSFSMENQNATSGTTTTASSRVLIYLDLATSLTLLVIISAVYIVSYLRVRRKWLALAERNARISSADVLRACAENTWELLPLLETQADRGRAHAIIGRHAETNLLWAADPWVDNLSQGGDTLFSSTTEEADALEVSVNLDDI